MTTTNKISLPINWVKNINQLNLTKEQKKLEHFLRSASLTYFLECHYKTVKAQILNLTECYVAKISFDEIKNSIHSFIKAPFYQREIFLCADNHPKIWAESLCSTESDFWCTFFNCGETPLGHLLFNKDLLIERSEFNYAWLTKQQLPICLHPFLSDKIPRLIARQSFFTHAKKEAFSLTEVFLLDEFCELKY